LCALLLSLSGVASLPLSLSLLFVVFVVFCSLFVARLGDIDVMK
jgi:hypothetical protein